MVIVPNPEPGRGKSGSLYGLKLKDIVDVLGFLPNVEDDPDKVENSWGFLVYGEHNGQELGGVRCGIWDYKGSHRDEVWSFYGPRHIFLDLFGLYHVRR